MARADVMYGVTMEVFGVSKPVGMRLTAGDGMGKNTESKIQISQSRLTRRELFGNPLEILRKWLRLAILALQAIEGGLIAAAGF